MRKIYFLGLFVLLFAGLTACQKKHYQLTAKQSDEEAIQTCLKLSEKKRFEEAVECLEIFKSRFPESTYALEAELNIADNYFRKKDWLLAAESYNLFIRLHPNSDKLDYAYYRSGLAYEKLLPKKIDRDLSNSSDAQDSFAAVFRRFPESPYASLAQTKYDEIRQLGAKKSMYIARFYYKYKEYRAAVPRFIEVLQDYPGLGFEEEALYYLALSYHRLKLPEQAKGAAEMMKEKFPESKKTKKIEALVLGGKDGRNS